MKDCQTDYPRAGSLHEVAPNILMYVYGAWGPGGGGTPYQLHSQLLLVTPTGLEPESYQTADDAVPPINTGAR